jgi:N-methylhydantoinase A/acetone carboxylase beta subunit
MTDAFVVDEHGGFTIGKAQTTPGDDSAGIAASLRNAAGYTHRTAEQIGPELVATVYSGTAMLNRLLERTSTERIGVIVSAGLEDYLQLERAVQTYAGYPYADRLHAVTHVHNEPLVPRRMIRGVRGRISFFGEEVIPLYRDEAERAVTELLDAGANSLAISLLYSYRDSAHEDEIAEIARKLIAARGVDVEVHTSSGHSPVRGDLARLNTLLVELYAAKPSRANLRAIRDRLEREVGSTAPVRVVTSYGGTISPEHDSLVSTIVSGPIGGLIGADALVRRAYGGSNVVCTDVGGTSFDVGLISERVVATRTEPMMARMLLALPHVAMDSIGAGTGTRIRVDRTVDRVVLGPDSAGSRIGVCWPDSGETMPSLTDCDVVLGLVNPDYFLGGEIPLDVERARAALAEHIVKPLGAESVERAALGIVALLQTQMRDHLTGMILGMGYAPENYDLLCYGGGGPLHVAGYTRGLGFQAVRVPAWAAAFSAFGCACADYTYRYDRSIDLHVTPAGDPVRVWTALEAVWAGLREQVLADCRRDGIATADVTLTTSVRMQYFGMLDDLEITVGPRSGDPTADLATFLAEFDALFSKVFARAARSPESGYFVTKAILVGTYATEKPVIPEFELSGEQPSSRAEKGTRRVFEDAGWTDARLYEMAELASGNVVTGPAVIEDAATTFYVPSGYRTVLDRFRVFELQRTPR